MKKRTFYILVPCLIVGFYVGSYVVGFRNGYFSYLIAPNDPFGKEEAREVLRNVYLPLSEAEQRLIDLPRFRRDLAGHWRNHENLFIKISKDGEYSGNLFGTEREGLLKVDREAGDSYYLECYDTFSDEGVLVRLVVSHQDDSLGTGPDAIELTLYEEGDDRPLIRGLRLEKFVEQDAGGKGG